MCRFRGDARSNAVEYNFTELTRSDRVSRAQLAPRLSSAPLDQLIASSQLHLNGSH